MKNVVKSWRYWLMAAIAMIALVALIAEPSQHTEHYWLALVCSKLTAVVLAYIDVRLFAWWAKNRQIDDILAYINDSE